MVVEPTKTAITGKKNQRQRMLKEKGGKLREAAIASTMPGFKNKTKLVDVGSVSDKLTTL